MNRPPLPHREPLPADVQVALQAGQSIEAIRRLRAATGLGLREAKALIDAAQAGQAGQRAGAADRRHAPVEDAAWRRHPGWIVLAIAGLILLGWWLAGAT